MDKINKNTGESVDYYKVKVDNPTTPGNEPYIAECNDIIEALDMTYAEGNIFKAIWRAAASKQGNQKHDYDGVKYDAEKIIFFGNRLIKNKSIKSVDM